MKKLVSVIIPVYNGEQYLEETLRFVMNSCYKNIEVIIVNDGSRDDSENICRQMAERDERIKIFSQENQGIAAARNKGISMANGEYVCFCDQDDLMHPDMISELVASIEREHAEYAICSVGRLYGDKVFPKYCIQGSGTYSNEEIIEDILKPIVFSPLYAERFVTKRWDVWGALFLKRIIDEYNLSFYSYISYEDDKIFTINYLLQTKTMVVIRDVLYLWRYNMESESSVLKYRENYIEKIDNYEKYIKEICFKIGGTEEEYHNYIVENSISYLLMLTDNMIANQQLKTLKSKIDSLKQIINDTKYIKYVDDICRPLSRREKLYLILLRKRQYFLTLVLGWITAKMGLSKKYRLNKIKKQYIHDMEKLGYMFTED